MTTVGGKTSASQPFQRPEAAALFCGQKPTIGDPDDVEAQNQQHLDTATANHQGSTSNITPQSTAMQYPGMPQYAEMPPYVPAAVDPNMMQGQNATASDSVLHISIKAPQFSPQYASAWFDILEAQFNLSNIRRQETKFYNTLSALPADTVAKLSREVVQSTDYTALRTAVLAMYERSKSEIFDKLTMRAPLTGRPTQLMNELQQQACQVGVGEDLVRHRFLQSLPLPLMAALGAQPTLTLDQLAKLADDIAPLVQNANTNVVQPAAAQFHAVQQQPMQVQAVQQQTRQEQRPPQQLQQNQQMPHQNRNFQTGNPGLTPFYSGQRAKICRSHIFYADKARTCKPWCAYPKKDASLQILPSSRPSSRSASPTRGQGNENGN